MHGTRRLLTPDGHCSASTQPRVACATRGLSSRQRTCKSTKAATDDAASLKERVAALEMLVSRQQELLSQCLAAPRTASPVSRPMSPFEAQAQGSYGDRRLLGLFDARFHSTASGATPKDYRVLPDRIFLVRHAESEGNVDNTAYAQIPDSQVPLTARGQEQARQAGQKIRQYIEQHTPNPDYQLFFYTSPYKRSLQTYEHIITAFSPDRILGVQEEVQLREQDFGNFQDPRGKQHEKMERLRFGRFFYRFPDGESGADVYDRLTIFEDHLIRDINAGRYSGNMNLVLVTHGLALRIFLMRWFHWRVDEFLQVYNPPNAEPLVLERVPTDVESQPGGSVSWIHTKALYTLTPESMERLKGCTWSMCTTSHFPRSCREAQQEQQELQSSRSFKVVGADRQPLSSHREDQSQDGSIAQQQQEVVLAMAEASTRAGNGVYNSNGNGNGSGRGYGYASGEIGSGQDGKHNGTRQQ